MELKETNKPDYHHLISGDMSINTQCECVCNKGILKKQAFRCFKSFGLFSILLFFVCGSPTSVCAETTVAANLNSTTTDAYLRLVILLIISLSIIIMLSFSLLHYKRKLRDCRKRLLRNINENTELKKRIPVSERFNYSNSLDVSPEEFIQIINNIMKKLTL